MYVRYWPFSAKCCSKGTGNDIACPVPYETVCDGTSFLGMFVLAPISVARYTGGILIGRGFKGLIAASSGLSPV